MREIKFRGKRIDNGELACGHLCYIENEPVIITGYVKQTNGSFALAVCEIEVIGNIYENPELMEG